MNNVNQLFGILTEINPKVRYGALTAIADPERKIISGRWGDGDEGCLFIVAAGGATRRMLMREERQVSAVATILGFPEEKVSTGIKIWDHNLNNAGRQQFREQIARYLEKTYPIATSFLEPARTAEFEPGPWPVPEPDPEPEPVGAETSNRIRTGILPSIVNRVGVGIGVVSLLVAVVALFRA